MNQVGVPLVSVIVACTVGTPCLLHYIVYNYLKLLICSILMEPTLHCFTFEFSKALHALTITHHHNNLHDLLFILPNELQSQEKKCPVMQENIRLLTLHNLHVVLSEFEWCFLESHVSRRTRDYKAKVDMNYMPICIHQNVVVMSVLYLKNILKKRISCQTLCKVYNRFLPVFTKKLSVNLF